MIDRLLSSLHSVRETSASQWMAFCPAHDDRSPSLSIRLTLEGRTLLHCFAGCPAASVAAACGLSLADLMGEGPRDCKKGVAAHGRGFVGISRQAWEAKFRIAGREAMIVALYMEAQWRAEDASLEDEDRVVLAVQRLRQLAEEFTKSVSLEDAAVKVAERHGQR